MIDSYKLLLLEAARLYEKHEAGRPDPFNVFSVLRSHHDEVNLHSRFLHALLDHRQTPGEVRENLADFLRLNCLRELSRKLSVDVDDLDPDRATVERERGNIDILIHDPSSKRAVVIENKIWAGDQPGQLWRYAEQLKGEGYIPHLLYLTLDGHKPSSDSVRDLQYECISYKEDLLPWLKCCQQRAYDEPALRESVAQYLHLIAELTGNDYSEAYMKDLKKLCLEKEKDHLVLIHHLNQATIEARVWVLQELWKEIYSGLREKIPDLPDKDLANSDSDITEPKIRGFVTGYRGCKDFGLYYRFRDCASLGIVAEDCSISFGVYCPKKDNEDCFNQVKQALGGDDNNSFWPYWKYAPGFEGRNLRNSIQCEDVKLLMDLNEGTKKQKYVEDLVSCVRDLWNRIKNAGLA